MSRELMQSFITEKLIECANCLQCLQTSSLSASTHEHWTLVKQFLAKPMTL